MKLIICTALYGRHELSEIVLAYYNSIAAKHNLALICVGSEGDQSKQLAERNGFQYIETPNYPLNQKFNILSLAVKNIPDHSGMMLIGSDDLVSENIIELYKDEPDAKKMLGYSQCYFFDCKKKQLKYFKGYMTQTHSSHTVGAGRYFSKNILQQVDYKLWSGVPKNNKLDTDCHEHLRKHGIGEARLNLAAINGAIIDVKYENNITPITAIRNYVICNSQKQSEVWNLFPLNIKEKINNLPSR